VLSVEDRHEIEDLYGRLNWAIDTGDADEWLDAFTADGVFSANDQVVSGHEALRKWIRARLEFRMTESTTNGQHWVTNIDAEGDDTEARVRCYFMRTVHARDTGEVHVHATGWFEDQLRKINGRWRFQRHAVAKQMPWHFVGPATDR